MPLLLVSALGGCKKGTIISNNSSREYLYHIPSGIPSENLPVLFVLHGNPSNGWQMKTWTGMNATADEFGFMVVYPYALDNKWPVNPADNEAEITYFENFLKEISVRHPVDTNRFYLSGMSGGGIFSFQLMREMPEKFAAFAVIAANMPRAYSAKGFRAAPLVYFHGTEDFLYNGRGDLWSADETLDIWQEVNACLDKEEKSSLPDINNTDDSTVEKYTYCKDSAAAIEFYMILGGGHHWPGARFDANWFYSEPLGAFNKDINANEVLWNFVSQYSLSDPAK